MKYKIWFKLIAVVLINAFFCLDITCAAGGNMKDLSTHLSPALSIDNKSVKGYFTQPPQINTNMPQPIPEDLIDKLKGWGKRHSKFESLLKKTINSKTTEPIAEKIRELNAHIAQENWQAGIVLCIEIFQLLEKLRTWSMVWHVEFHDKSDFLLLKILKSITAISPLLSAKKSTTPLSSSPPDLTYDTHNQHIDPLIKIAIEQYQEDPQQPSTRPYTIADNAIQLVQTFLDHAGLLSLKNLFEAEVKAERVWRIDNRPQDVNADGHAGPMGIYVFNPANQEMTPKDRDIWEAGVLVHELIAKAGSTHVNAAAIEEIFEEYIDRDRTVPHIMTRLQEKNLTAVWKELTTIQAWPELPKGNGAEKSRDMAMARAEDYLYREEKETPSHPALWQRTIDSIIERCNNIGANNIIDILFQIRLHRLTQSSQMQRVLLNLADIIDNTRALEDFVKPENFASLYHRLSDPEKELIDYILHKLERFRRTRQLTGSLQEEYIIEWTERGKIKIRAEDGEIFTFEQTYMPCGRQITVYNGNNTIIGHCDFTLAKDYYDKIVQGKELWPDNVQDKFKVRVDEKYKKRGIQLVLISLFIITARNTRLSQIELITSHEETTAILMNCGFQKTERDSTNASYLYNLKEEQAIPLIMISAPEVVEQLEALLDEQSKEFIRLALLIGYQQYGISKADIDRIIEVLLENKDNPERAANIIRTELDYGWYHNYRSSQRPIMELELIQQHISSGTFVDVGGGYPGALVNAIANDPRVEKVIVTDIEEEYAQSQDGPTILFITHFQDNIFYVPLPPIADTILLKYVLHHINNARLKKFLQDIFRVLKPGGRVIIFEDSYSEHMPPELGNSQLIEKFSGLSNAQKTKFLRFSDWFSNRVAIGIPGIPMPFNFKSIEQWQNIFEEIGFHVEPQYIGFLENKAHQVPLAFMVLTKPINDNAKSTTAHPNLPATNILFDTPQIDNIQLKDLSFVQEAI
ncbi:MAG: methyltransferase [Candidatus Omnitrophota bacterium]